MKKEQDQKAYVKVQEFIKENLKNGTLALGDKLPPERELAERLEISRNSVREAIRTFEHLGFITSEQGAGNFLSCDVSHNFRDSLNLMFLIGSIDYHQVSEMRCALETQAAVLASLRSSPAELEMIEQTVEMIHGQDDDIDHDRQLHDLIARASKNELIIQILTALYDAVETFFYDMRRQIALDDASNAELLEMHRQLVRGIRGGDTRMIRHAIRRHYEIVDAHMKGFDDPADEIKYKDE